VHGGDRTEGLAGAREETGAVRCAAGLGLAPEEPARFTRQLEVPEDTDVVPQLLLRPRSGSALDDVMRGDPATRARQVRAVGSSLVDDPSGAASAAVDGDRSTSWHAEDLASPELELRLPGRQLVDSLRLWAPRSQTPAAPRVVTVDTGDESTTVDLDTLATEDDGSVEIPLPPERTDRVSVQIDSADEVRTEGGATVPPGIAEVWVRDASGARIGALPAAHDEPITLGCQDGPRLTIDGRVVQTRLSTTRQDLLEGRAVAAEPCDDTPVALPAGPVEVSVDPGQAFSVDTVGLVVDPGDDDEGGTDADRVPAAPRERVLVVPENVSPAWQATLVAEDGTALPDPRPVTVDGWKQGWVLPASGAGMTLELAVPAETPYRAALLTGPFALLLVLLLFLVRGADRAGAAARPWRARGLVTVAATAAVAGLVAGPAGLAITVGLGAGALLASRYRGADRARDLLVVGAGTGIVAGAVLLSRAPWPDATGYAGDGAAPQ